MWVVCTDIKRKSTQNNTDKKLVVQWLNEVLCFVSSSVLADSLVLRNRQLLVAANRWEKSPFGTIFPNDRSATPTVGKQSLLPHNVLQTLVFEALQSESIKLLSERRQSRAVIMGYVTTPQ